jgi:ABC-type antimicrobial peptide transport system permease subunit
VFGIFFVGYFTSDRVGLATEMYVIFGLLTLPLSSLPFLLIWLLRPSSEADLILKVYLNLFYIMPFVGAFFNAAIIYLVVGYVIWGLQSLSKR